MPRPDHSPPDLKTAFRARTQSVRTDASMNQPPPQNQATTHIPPTGLTPVFNHAAAGTESRPPDLVIDRRKADANLQKRIATLRKSMSQPKPSLEYGRTGSVVRSYQSRRDQRIAAQIKAFETSRQRLRKVGHTPTTKSPSQNQTQIKPTLRQSFNRASLGRSL